jgi:hypothetical protein
VTGLSLNASDRLALAAAGVREGADGSLRSDNGSIVSPGVTAALISRGDALGKGQEHPVRPGDFTRPYLTAGHAADSPANRSRAQPMPMPDVATGGRSTTPPDDGDASAQDGGVEKVTPDRREFVDWGDALRTEAERFGALPGPEPPPAFRVVEPEDWHRGPLTAGHESPSPGDHPGNSPIPATTGSGHARYQAGVIAYEANQQQARTQHVMPTQCVTSKPAMARYSPPPDMGASNVPQTQIAGATRKAPGE